MSGPRREPPLPLQSGILNEWRTALWNGDTALTEHIYVGRLLMEKRLQTTKDYTSENTSTTDCCIYTLPTCSDWSQRRDPALCSVFSYFLSSGVRPQIKIRLRSDPSFFVRLLCFNADQDDSRKKKKKNVNLRLFKTADSRFALSYHCEV